MRLHVASDLHLDLMKPAAMEAFWARLRDSDRAVDALVLAGDIGTLADGGDDLLDDLFEFQELYQRVVFVPGNHEFWGTSITDGLDTMFDWRSQRFSKTDIRPRDTLWFPEPPTRLGWPDYARIRDSRWAIESQHSQWKVRNAVLPPDFVVTHHLPVAEAVAPRWRGAGTNAYFVGGLEEWLQGRKVPPLWICGHTHDPVDVQSRFGFRIYANPLGYENEGANPGFWDRLLVEVPDPSP